MNDQGFDEKSFEIRRLASLPPEQLADHLASIHPGIAEIAPNLLPHIQAAATNAITFLNSKLPTAGNELLQDSMPSFSKAQKKAWLDLHEVVNNPVSVLDRLKDNHLNRHHLEALQTVYPDLHQEMSQKIQEHLGALKMEGKQIPYSRRLMLSKFIGTPLDSTMLPSNMQAIMASAQNNPPPTATQQKGNAKASGTELTQINRVTRLYQTPTQARLSQKRD